MKEGDQVLGGDQVTPANAPSITPDPASATSGSDDSSSVLQIHHDSPSPNIPSSPTPQATAIVNDTATPSDAPDNTIVLDNIPPATEEVHASDNSDSDKPAGDIIDAVAPDNAGESSTTADATPSDLNLNIANNIDGINRISTAAPSSPIPNISRPTGVNTTIPVNTIPTGIAAPDFARPALQAPTTLANPTPTMASPNPTMMAAPGPMWTTGVNPTATAGSYAGNDIVLGGTTPEKKKSKKWIIFVSIGLIAVALVGALVMWMILGNNGQKKDTSISLLNIYSNYLLYGVESSEPISDVLGTWNTDQVEQEMFNDNLATKEAYFNSLVALFDNFSNNFKNDSGLQDSMEKYRLEYTTNLINNTSAALYSIKEYSLVPRISTEEMINMYLVDGGETMLSYVNNIFANISGSDNSNISSYGKIKIDLANTIVNTYSKYEENGCIKNQKLIQNCVVDNDIEETYTLSAAIQYAEELQGITDWHMTNDLLSFSEMLYGSINKKENN